MFVRWNFTICWVTHSSFAISSFERPRGVNHGILLGASLESRWVVVAKRSTSWWIYRLPVGGGTLSCAQILRARPKSISRWRGTTEREPSGAAQRVWFAPSSICRQS